MASLDWHESALARLYRWAGFLAVVGFLVWLIWRGLAPAIAFAGGSFLSVVNLWFLHSIALALGAGPERPLRTRPSVLALRFLAIGVAGFVILRLTQGLLPAVCAGLLVAAGAVLIEIIYELIYARA